MTTAVKTKSSSSSLSVMIVIAITLVALLVGWLIKSSIESQVQKTENKGVSVMIPKGWSVQKGIGQEETVISASDPLDPLHKYMVSVLPASPTGLVTDSVVGRNLARGQSLSGYQVLSQGAEKVQGADGYKVTYGYVVSNGQGRLPDVVEGVDYFIVKGGKVLVISMEEIPATFDAVLPSFMNFLDSVSYTPGA